MPNKPFFSASEAIARTLSALKRPVQWQGEAHDRGDYC